MEVVKRFLQERQGWKQATEKIAEIANSKDNCTIVMLERLRNPVIYKQMFELSRAYETSRRGLNETPVWLLNNIQERFKRATEAVATETFIKESPDAKSDTWGIASYKKRDDGTPQTTQDLTITEAHEKFHRIHPTGFPSDPAYFNELYRGVLDGSRIKRLTKTQEQYDYMLSAAEIAVRMSQLKNYFGMQGDETFTLVHLRYAQKNYVKDTGHDNNMSAFLWAVTKETEKQFLHLINTTGI